MPLRLRVVAEWGGVFALVAVIVGSGLMAEQLTPDAGVALFLNQFSTILALSVLIALLLPISGAHLNPAVTTALLVTKRISIREAVAYLIAQFSGGVAGTLVAHAMFGQPLIAVSHSERITPGAFLAEIIATGGLVVIVLGAILRGRSSRLALWVPAWIGSAYLFTSSTAFSNPAVTVGRIFTDSFSGIAPASSVWFIAAQLIAALLAATLVSTISTVYRSRRKVVLA